MQKYTLHQTCIDNLETLRQSGNPLSEWLILAVLLFIKKTPIDFGILKNGGYRSAKDQNEIFTKTPHVTQCDGYNNKSKHQSGLAVDLVPWVENNYTWDKIHATAISTAFIVFCRTLGLDVISGSDWDGDGDLRETFFDPTHFEIRGLL